MAQHLNPGYLYRKIGKEFLSGKAFHKVKVFSSIDGGEKTVFYPG
jgi:hypothetical protein